VYKAMLAEDRGIIERHKGEEDPDFTIKRAMENAKERLIAYENDDWTTILDTHIRDYQKMVTQEQNLVGAIAEDYLYSMETTLEQLKIIHDKNIKPVFPIKRPITKSTFSSPKDEEAYRLAMKKFDASSMYFMYMAFGIFFGIFGIGFFIFLFNDILTKEGPGRGGPIHFLYTQPVKRFKVIVSKYIAMVIVSLAFLAGSTGLSFILGTVFDRMGNGDYPILINGDENAFSFMNLSTFLTKAMILFILGLLFTYALMFVLSIVTRNNLATLGGTFAILILGMKFGSQDYLSNIVHFIPFTYFSPEGVISRETALALNNFDVTFKNGIISLTLSIIILWCLSYLLLKVKHGFKGGVPT
ncbi:MAG TPA: ABC transporter permease, partial [Bacillota bacterium]|nr:ABC transporter permease [Bacillota bacterium]